jgi:streptogramin lyase
METGSDNKDTFIKKIWITTDSGLVLFDPYKRKLSYRGHNVENNPAIRHFENKKNLLGIRADAFHHLLLFQWFPEKDHPLVHQFDKRTGKHASYHLSQELGIGYHELYGFLQQQNKRMWLYGMPVFAEWKPERKSFVPLHSLTETNTNNAIKFQRVSACTEDKDGNLWLATDNGVFRFHPEEKNFRTYILPTGTNDNIDASISAVSETHDGNIFISTWTAGLHYFNPALQRISLLSKIDAIKNDIKVWNIHQHTKTGKIWFGLQRGEKTLLIYDTLQQSLEWVTDTIFRKKTVRQMIEDHQGNLWFGMYDGRLIKWNAKSSNRNPQTGYQLVFEAGAGITRLYMDARHTIWIGTNGNGLYKLDYTTNKITKHFSTNAKSPYNLYRDIVSDIIQLNDSTLAIATGNIALLNLKNNSIIHLTTSDGLPSHTARSLQVDKKGILWMGMTNGICRSNIEKKIFTLYDRKDGLDYDNFEQSGAYQLKDGTLIFSTSKNFIAFHPSQMVKEGRPPAPVLTSFRLGNQFLLLDSIMGAGVAKLSYDNSSIAIEFGNLRFLGRERLRYYYMLEGLDKNWILANDSKQALYNYIPPGDYLFKVRSENENGEISNKTVTLHIKVVPPFWKTMPFYALMALLFLLFIYAIDRERMKRITTVLHMRSQLGNDLHTDIQTTLSDINVLSAMAKIKADKDTVRSKEYIEQISEKSSTMMESMDDILWSIDPQNDSIQKMLLRIQEYNASLISVYSVPITLLIEGTTNKLALDMQKRHDFLQFYKISIHYLLQLCEMTPINVRFQYKQNRLYLEMNANCIHGKTNSPALIKIKREIENKADTLQAEFGIFEKEQNLSLVLQKNV